MEAKISLERDFFNIDEDVNIEFDIDNRDCLNDVKSLKVKLHQDISVYAAGDRTKIVWNRAEYIEEVKYNTNVKAGTKLRKFLTFKLPGIKDRNKDYITLAFAAGSGREDFSHITRRATFSHLPPSHYE